MDAGGAGITGQPVGLGGGTGGEMGGEEGVQAGGRKIGYLLQADPARAGSVRFTPDKQEYQPLDSIDYVCALNSSCAIRENLVCDDATSRLLLTTTACR